jgi:uncharacterized membrane protein YhhN
VTRVAWVLLAVAGAFAVGDWIAVARRSRPLEYACKPAVVAAMIGVALTVDPGIPAQRWWFVAALTFSLLGDVLLMLPTDRLGPGLASFLLAHLAYIRGLWLAVAAPTDALGPAAAVVLVGTLLLWRILAAVRAGDDRPLAIPVALYGVAISLMLISAAATRQPPAILGALLFYTSDLLLAWNRFVRAMAWAPVAIIVTYHLGQAGLVLSLLD